MFGDGPPDPNPYSQLVSAAMFILGAPDVEAFREWMTWAVETSLASWRETGYPAPEVEARVNRLCATLRRQPGERSRDQVRRFGEAVAPVSVLALAWRPANPAAVAPVPPSATLPGLESTSASVRATAFIAKAIQEGRPVPTVTELTKQIGNGQDRSWFYRDRRFQETYRAIKTAPRPPSGFRKDSGDIEALSD
jgi:hypothetical protein